MDKAQREWAIIERMMVGDYDPDQPRDLRGRWAKRGDGLSVLLGLQHKSDYPLLGGQTVQEIEDSIRNEKHEYAICFDNDGNMLFKETSGSRNFVWISERSKKLLRGNTLTHNHPNGMTFSYGDLATALKYGCKAIRACYNGGAYIIAPIYGADRNRQRQFVKEYKKVQKSAERSCRDLYNRKILSRKDANGLLNYICSAYLSNNADRYGFEYREETD